MNESIEVKYWPIMVYERRCLVVSEVFRSTNPLYYINGTSYAFQSSTVLSVSYLVPFSVAADCLLNNEGYTVIRRSSSSS